MLELNELEYLEMPGLNVMLAHDYYPEGHQGGVGFIQNGIRVGTNGDLRLDRTPGQWQPVPKVGQRSVNRATGEISIKMAYPDPERNRKGFNPVTYANLHFSYTLKVLPDGDAFRIIAELDSQLPSEWIGRVGLNLELFPGNLFGKTYAMDSGFGVFSLQANGPGKFDARGEYEIEPLGHGQKLVIAAESETQSLTIESVQGGELELIDGRGNHTNGWFVVRASVVAGCQTVEWIVRPRVIPNFLSKPVIQISQVGYHPDQTKIAVVELDKMDIERNDVILERLGEDGSFETALSGKGVEWGRFLRFSYVRFDFSSVRKPGFYSLRYGSERSSLFKISSDVFSRHVWQPTLEYFLPIQMCHIKVRDGYRLWHGVCHLDDAVMADVNHIHFDGYLQGPSTLCDYQPGEHIKGLNRGGWHDAGDFDLRVESQIDTVHGLTLAYEEFHVDYDNTTINQEKATVELRRPDGKPDILQQIEHGLLSVVGAYRALGRFYRGVIEPSLEQYVLIGDPASEMVGRMVFTEDNPDREFRTAAGLSAASRAMRGFNPKLSEECLAIAVEVWKSHEKAVCKSETPRIYLAIELFLTTESAEYSGFLVKNSGIIKSNFKEIGWLAVRTIGKMKDAGFKSVVESAVRAYDEEVKTVSRDSPYDIPYKPYIWGAGWGIQAFGVREYFIHKAYPQIHGPDYFLAALNFILGCHPGSNTASFVSGVGTKSVTVAYGMNRADHSFIPGGSVSGTALIRPDFPELLEWPYLWQQTEYVLGRGTSDFLILALAADHMFKKSV